MAHGRFAKSKPETLFRSFTVPESSICIELPIERQSVMLKTLALGNPLNFGKLRNPILFLLGFTLSRPEGSVNRLSGPNSLTSGKISCCVEDIARLTSKPTKQHCKAFRKWGAELAVQPHHFTCPITPRSLFDLPATGNS